MRWQLILFFGLWICGTAWSQSTLPASETGMRITEVFTGAPLEEAFARLEARYGIVLAYDPAAVRGLTVRCRLQDLSLPEALDRLLRDAPFTYQVIDARHVLILPEEQGLGGKAPTDSGFILRGQVTDAVTGAPLPFATLLFPTTGSGVAADEDGRFEVRCPADSLALSVRYVGYAPRLLRLDRDGAAAPLVIPLYSSVEQIASVTVAERAPLVSLSREHGALRFDGRQVGGLPDFVGGPDLFRSLQLLPGISAADDLSAGLQIRGGGTEENLIMLDGMTLYRLDHFYGVFSAINPHLVGQVDLYKNAFPARYGGRTAGVVDMRTRRGEPGQAGGQAEVNLLTSNAYLRLPLAPNLELLTGGRLSNGNISDDQLFGLIHQERLRPAGEDDPLSTLSRRAVVSQTPDFRFYDANARLQWTPNDGSRLALNFFQSFDQFENGYQNTFYNTWRRLRIRNTEFYEETSSWRNTGLSLQAEHRWTDRWQSMLTLSRSTFDNDNSLQASLQREISRRDTTIGITNRNRNAIEGYSLSWENRWRLSENQGLNAGYQGQRHAVRYELGIDADTLLAGRTGAWEQAVFAEWDGRLSSRWRLRAGLRGTYYGANEQFYFSPRFQLEYKPVDRWYLQVSGSRYYQFLREIDYETRLGNFQPFYVLGGTANFPVAASNHIAAGIRYLGESFGLEVEYFDRRTDGALEYALVRAGFDADSEAPARTLDYYPFTGEGRSYGIDVLLRKTSGAYTGWVAYTLSKTTNRFPEILNGADFPASNDRRHQLQVVNQYRWGRWTFSGAYVFASGRPYTDLADLARLSAQAKERRLLRAVDRLSYLDDYHRVDLGLQYAFDLGPLQAYAGASVFNLLNRQNVKYRQYVFAIPETLRISEEFRSTLIGNELEMLDRTFNVKAGIRF